VTGPVAVVGLGPVGATLALLLARAGIATLAIDREEEILPLSRAVALDDEALRVLQAAGIAGARAPALLTRQTVRFRSRDGAPLLDLPPRLSMTGHPALAFFHQPELEGALRAELHRHPLVTLLLGHELEHFDQRTDGVTIRLRDRRSGTAFCREVPWLLACDGASSTVRRRLGIRLRGITSRRRWLVVDVQRPAGPDPAAFEFLCHPGRPTVGGALPGGRQRWEFMLLPGEDARAMVRPEVVRRLLARHPDTDADDVLRAAVYTFHARVAERWRDGRVFLLGDAAHLSPPFAGQGLSAGLHDAHNLAWKIAVVVKGSAGPALLDTYATERRPHVAKLIALAVLLGLAVQTRRPRLAAIRDASLRALLRGRAVRAWAVGGGWKPPSRYDRGFVRTGRSLSAAEGAQIPQPEVAVEGALTQPLDDVLGPGFALVGLGTDPAAGLDARSRATLDALSVRLVHVAFGCGSPTAADTCGVTRVRDLGGALERCLQDDGASLVLVRPDRHVYAALRTDELASAVAGLAAALSPPGRPR